MADQFDYSIPEGMPIRNSARLEQIEQRIVEYVGCSNAGLLYVDSFVTDYFYLTRLQTMSLEDYDAWVSRNQADSGEPSRRYWGSVVCSTHCSSPMAGLGFTTFPGWSRIWARNRRLHIPPSN